MARPTPTSAVRPPDRHAATEERPANAVPAQAQAPRPAARPTPRPAPTYAQPDHSHPEHGQARAGTPVTPAAHPARPAPTKTPKKNDERND